VKVVSKNWIRLIILSLLCLTLQGIYSTASFAATGDSDTYLSLNGTSQYANVPEGTTFVGRGTYTAEAWFNPSSTTCPSSGTQYCTIFSHPGDFSVYIVDGILQISISYNGNLGSSSIPTYQKPIVGTWQHVALVKNGAGVTLYLNGTVIETTTISGYTGPSTQSNAFNIGRDSGSTYFAGGLDEFRLYSTALTQAQVQSDMNAWGPANASGLVAYYDFNDAGASTASNKVTGSTSSTNLTFINSATTSAIETSTVSGGYQIVTFPRSYISANGGYKIPDGITTVNALIVGAGGGGGMDGGAGGGGGGTYENSVAVTPASNIDIDVGAGGPAGAGYTPAPVCNTSWSSTAVGCAGGDGTTSRLGSISVGGGGGGGGIENSGDDAPTGFTVRGNGGGVGGQNSKTGTGTAGGGTYRGGNVSDNSLNTSGSGGGGASANGADGSGNTAGNGGAGYTATINSLIYGAGGGGGTFGGSGNALGGGVSNSGAGNGANGSSPYVNPTIPLPNRGGGGGGGGNGGGGVANAYGSPGGSGVVILKFTQRSTVSISYSGTPTFRSISNLVANTSTASRVTFFANGKKIPGCVSLLTTNNSVTCPWKPSTHNTVPITIKAIPIDSNYNAVTMAPSYIGVVLRGGKR